MVYFFNTTLFNRILLYCLLFTFSLVILKPTYAYAQLYISNVAFGIRIQKLTDKMNKYKEKKNSSKLIDTMLDIKSEIEAFTGNKFDINKEIDKIEVLVKKKGAKVPKNELKLLKKIINNKDKKINNRFACMTSYLENPSNMEFEVYEKFYFGNIDQEDKEVMELPYRLTVGITMTLAGAFLVFVGTRLPIPICKTIGEPMLVSGIGFLIEGYGDKQEENKAKEKQKNKI
ncbi:MAG: hypothetical protein Q8K60_00765 [Parachlamydiaceae bacterium]|nr:hypothetical protein [Parachlamydiaceae bacterium]